MPDCEVESFGTNPALDPLEQFKPCATHLAHLLPVALRFSTHQPLQTGTLKDGARAQQTSWQVVGLNHLTLNLLSQQSITATLC
jgi:hypothetical protein